MGIVRKPEMESYWRKETELCRTPFFGRYMSRDRFQSILANLHFVDDSTNPAFGEEGYDPLAKHHPFVTMCSDNFKFTYKPGRDLSFDEGCCPWKGHLHFRCYNPTKPAKFPIKLFQISEAKSRYISAFNMYTGKNSCVKENVTIDLFCTTTTKTVMTLAEEAVTQGTMYIWITTTHLQNCVKSYCTDIHSHVAQYGQTERDYPFAAKKLKPSEACFR